jgi:alanine racemase
MTGLATATVDLSALAHNVGVFASHTEAGVLAVVKANGFGHGAVQVADAALAAGATWLGVTSCAEALELRAHGISAPILSWLHSPFEDFGPALLADVDLSVSSADHLLAIAASAATLGITANVQLKADTGLHRNGAPEAEWDELVRQARDLEIAGSIRVRAIWSHLVSGAVSAAPTIDAQIRRFDQALAVAHGAGLRPRLRHLANSAATLSSPRTHYELVRPGIGLYGVEPDPGHAVGLRPAMTVRTRPVLVKRVPAGSGVSYDHEYVTERDSTLALLPLGYADGVPWAAARRAQVWIAGRRYPVAGRIAMDQFVVDLGGDSIGMADEVVVFGNGDHGEPTVAEWAEWAGTLPHEILTGIGSRIARRHIHVPFPELEEVSNVR